MSKLPRVSGGDCVKAPKQAGFTVRRREGSHIIFRRDEPFGQVTVPDHRELDRGMLRAIIRSAGRSVNEFVELL